MYCVLFSDQALGIPKNTVVNYIVENTWFFYLFT